MAYPTAINAQITDAATAKNSVPIGADPGDPIISPTDPDQSAVDEHAKDVPKD